MRKTFEREINLPAKALFHIIFGDRSAVFQSLYKRRGINIVQHPWNPDRKFRYEVSRGVVLDVQTIEKQDEHICYVISDVRVPWHLPYSDSFTMDMRIAITHIAKTKCKLTVWTNLQWRQDPFWKGRNIFIHKPIRTKRLIVLFRSNG